MINNPDIPVFFEIEELENHIKSLPSNDLKLEYLINLYNEYVTVCYYFFEYQIKNYLNSKNLDKKYPSIIYYPSTDKYQTHISSSKYITFLQLIDKKLLPFVRKEIRKYNRSFKEDKSKLIKDYPFFGYDFKKIINFIHTLKSDKLSYIRQIFYKRFDYLLVENAGQENVELKHDIQNDELLNELRKMLITYERYPELLNQKNEMFINSDKDEPDLFKNDKSLCGFKLSGIKEHAKKIKNTEDAILYLMRVRKEALQNRHLIPDKNINHSFFTNLDHELDYYNKKQKVENEVISKQSISKTESSETQIDPIRLHWQSDDTLIPYLMKRLFDEGFINNADYELRKDFIEQSFYKRSGKIFTSKEVSAVESNTKANRKSNYKPGKAHKVDRVIGDLKSKRDEITQKKTSHTKKK